MTVGIPWENVNRLDINTILEMADDGYAFNIANGKIECVVVTIRFPF